VELVTAVRRRRDHDPDAAPRGLRRLERRRARRCAREVALKEIRFANRLDGDCTMDDGDRIDKVIVLAAVLLGFVLALVAGFPAGTLW